MASKLSPSLLRRFIIISLLVVTSEVPAQPMVEGEVVDLGVEVDSFFDPDPDGVVWSSGPIRRAGSDFLKLKFAAIRDSSSVNYKVRVVNEAQQKLQGFTKSEFSSVESRWTNLFPYGSVEIQVLADSPPFGLSFQIVKLAYERREAKLLSISMPDNREHLIDVTNNPGLLRAAEAIAKLNYTQNNKMKSCTGFLVDAKHFITNEHCVSSAEICESASAIFGFVLDEIGQEKYGPSYDCSEVVATSKDLDISILELAGEPGNTALGYLQFASDPADRRDDLAVIQHPGGEPKQVVRKSCKITTAVAEGNINDADFGHKCDTLSGSSGSPVLDLETMKIVGLHHLGFDWWGRWSNENRAVRLGNLRTFVEIALAEPP